MEKVEKKKRKKGLKKSTLLLCVVLLCILGAGGIRLLSRPALPEPTLLPDIILLNRTSDEISALAISAQDGINYPLVRGETGNFSLLGQENVALRKDVLNEMLSAVSKLEAENALWNTDEQIVDRAHFGLSPAQVQVSITYQDGEKKALYIGDAAPTDEPQYYCMISGDPVIYTVLAAFCDPFFQDAAYLRAFDQPRLNASLLDRIDISGQFSLGLSYTPSGWLMDTPYAYPLAPAKTDALLKSIESMAFEACLGSADTLDLSRFGLDAPTLRITLTQAPTLLTGETQDGEPISMEVPLTQYTFHIGNETGQGGVYLLWDGMVYRASNFLLGFWKELSVDSLLLRTPVNFLIHDLTHLSIRRQGEKYENHGYDIEMVEVITENNQIATNEYGQILYDAQVCRSGETLPMDAQAFLSWYTVLSALVPSGALPQGYQAAGEETAHITLKSQSITREISFYSYDALHDAMAVDGVSLYYIEKSTLETIIQNAP